jgi:uncharacterized protein (DUF952 family)
MGQRIMHVALADDWEGCLRFGEYDVATLVTPFDDTGYIHAATAAQLPAVLDGPYAHVKMPLLLIVLDEQALTDAESTSPGTPPDAVTAHHASPHPFRWRPPSWSRPSRSSGGTITGSFPTCRTSRCGTTRRPRPDRGYHHRSGEHWFTQTVSSVRRSPDRKERRRTGPSKEQDMDVMFARAALTMHGEAAADVQWVCQTVVTAPSSSFPGPTTRCSC